MFEGKNIYLRLMEKRDVKHKVKWINDPEVRKTLFFQDVSELATEQWLIKVTNDNTRNDYVICEQGNDTPIGFASVVNIDLRNSSAETYVCIGDKNYWGKGYGTEVKKLLTKYVFLELGLNRVYAYNWAENRGMIRINEKLGFTLEGTLRQERFSNGEYKDRVLFSMLREEFFKLPEENK
ncbi:GNAT family N-acetyltransferase [Oceanobacillus indicireducens]|uniref:N-acetyltransferase n=1 Tax=Oceanobacillus indicireducens TaxID=1004261 RepID=A0A918D533_9BACI|nr:GNAT family protein [Oceanobacillus indicireducens]GGN66862.1 N-acetyltransferase [Oceanobacillus indicireducens]